MFRPPLIRRWVRRSVIEQVGWDLAESRRRAERNLRVVFWLYTVLLLVATHYPKLKIGVPGDSPDKLIHFAAFGGWSLLLWLTGYVRSIRWTIVISLLFGLLDEISQSIPGLGRTFDPGDVLANSIGIVVVCCWIQALRSTNVPGKRVRAHELRSVQGLHRLLASPVNLIHLCLAGLLGSMMIGVFMIILFGRLQTMGPVTSAILGAVIGFGSGVILSAVIGFRIMVSRIAREEGDSFSEENRPRTELLAEKRKLIAGWIGIGILLVLLVWLLVWVLSLIIPQFGMLITRYCVWGANIAVVLDMGFWGGLAAFIGRRIRVGSARLEAGPQDLSTHS